jgi:hypothetical protein
MLSCSNLEHDMANDNYPSKTAATERKPLATRTPTPPKPQIPPPLVSDGMEALRDSNC